MAATLIVSGIVFLSPKSVLPIESETVSHIEFLIYPQDTPNFTVTDDTRIEAIISVLNSLPVEDSDSRSERMGEYYYSLILNCTGDNDIWIELDENTISINNENFSADTKPLHELLEKTYHDIQNWNIE